MFFASLFAIVGAIAYYEKRRADKVENDNIELKDEIAQNSYNNKIESLNAKNKQAQEDEKDKKYEINSAPTDNYSI